MAKSSILARLRESDLVPEPFPHLVVRDALDPDYYAELARTFPAMSIIAGDQPLANNRAYRLPAPRALSEPEVPAVWREFLAYHCSDAFLRELVTFWRPSILRQYPDFERMVGKPIGEVSGAMRHYARGSSQYMAENRRADVMLDCQFVINSPVVEATTVRGPHLDRPHTLFAALLYFRAPEDESTGGDLELYRMTRAGHRFDARYMIPSDAVTPFRRIEYAPNTLVMWLNTCDALHGVTPRAVTEHPRRYINFVADCYGLSTDTLFTVPMTPGGAVKDWVQRTLRRTLVRSPRREAA